MGMYTCLKFTGQLKEEYANFVKEHLTSEGREKDYEKDPDYEPWKEFAESHAFAENFAKLERADFIPFGGMTYYNVKKVGRYENCNNAQFSNLIYADDTDNYIESAGYETAYTWVFVCDLKNYNDEIETFLKEVAINICDKYIAEVWYEEFAFPRVLIFNEGNLKEVL